MRCEWREENGLRFLCVDNRGGPSTAEMLAVLDEFVSAVEQEGRGARVMLLVDPNERLHTDVLTALKHAIRDRIDPTGAKVAIVGVTGIGRTVLRGLQLLTGGHGAVAFPDRDSALAYLARG